MTNYSRSAHTLPSPLFWASFFILLCCCLQAAAQNDAGPSEDKVLPASKEKFQEASDLVSPWRVSGCLVYTWGVDWTGEHPDCYRARGKEWLNAHYLTLYDSDGSIWYGFSLEPFDSGYFRKNPRPDFSPLVKGKRETDEVVVLRMTGESKHWYEVEVNEQTRAVKYVLKSDPSWTKTTWDYWLYKGTQYSIGNFFTVGSDREMLRDRPNGKVIEKPGDFEVDRLFFLKMEGDWAYMQMPSAENRFRGWMRWRKGREFLVGCVFNNFTVPERGLKDDDKLSLSMP